MLLAVTPAPLKVTVGVPVKWVPVPTMATAVRFAPSDPLAGEMLENTGVLTVKDPVPVTTSLPVVTTTSLAPAAAPAAIAMLHVKCVELVTVTLLAVTLVPLKVTVVVPFTKFVFDPTIATLVRESPLYPLDGVMLVNVGVPGVETVYVAPLLDALDELTTQTVPVVAPVGTVTTIDVALHEVTVATKPLNSTNPVPCVALKFVPVIVTDEPTIPLVGFNDMVGAPVALGVDDI
jgi:hypothetical protein